MKEKQYSSEVRKIMLMEKISHWMGIFAYVFIAALFIVPVADHYLELGIPDNVWLLLAILIIVLYFGGRSTGRSVRAMRQEKEIGSTPDEIEAERKKNERLKSLVSSPEEMDRELKKLAVLGKILRKLFLVGLGLCAADIVMVILTEMGTELPGLSVIFMAFATIIFLVIPFLGHPRIVALQKDLALQYTPGVLNVVMDRLDGYDPSGSVDHKYLWEDFSFGKREWVGKCGDHVKGVLKGMPLEFSEFEFQYEKKVKDSDGFRRTEIRSSFSGLMVVCRHGIRLSNPVTLTQFSHFSEEQKTDSTDFNRAWSVKKGSGQDIFYLLTPQYMERLMELTRKKGVRFGIQFRPDGTLLIVVKDADFFEAGEAERIDELKEKLKNELLDLADTMQRIGALTTEEAEGLAVP